MATQEGHESTPVGLRTPRKYGTIDEWLELHKRIAPYISIQHESDRSIASPLPFSKKRSSIHTRIINDLKSFQDTLGDYGDELQRQLEKVQAEFKRSVPQTEPKTMNARKSLFLRSHIVQVKSDVVSHQLYALMEKQVDISSVLFLLRETNLIPEDQCIHLAPVFLTVRDINVDERGTEIDRLMRKVKALEKFEHPPAPVWKSDFHGFYMKIVTLYDSLVSKDRLFYVESQPIEDELAWCIRDMFYDKIKALTNASAAELPQAMSIVCKQIIPHDFLSDKTRYSLAMMATFRVVYEMTMTAGGKIEEATDPQLIRKVIELRKRPLTQFQFPQFLVREEVGDISIHDYFWYDPMYRASAQWLTTALFASNPFDALYHIHNALTAIEEKAKVLSGARGKEFQEVCLDDMFCLFLGSFLASDLLDVFTISKQITKFLTCLPMSPPFEHAQATLEALTLHITNLVDK